MPDPKTLGPKTLGPRATPITYRLLAASGQPVSTQAGNPIRTEQA